MVIDETLPVPAGPAPAPDPAPAGGGGVLAPVPLAVATEMGSIQKLMGDKTSAYHKGPLAEHYQARYRELLDARDTGEAPAKPDADAAEATELAEIRAMMGDRNSDYNKGPTAEPLQARYRELLDAAAGIEAGDLADVTTPEEFFAHPDWTKAVEKARPALTPALVAEWDGDGDFDTRLARSSVAVHAIEEAAGLDVILHTASFSEATSSAVMNELSMPPSTYSPLATKADIENFTGTEAGADLVAEWGRQAPRNVGIVRERISRLWGALDADGQKEFSWFFDHLEPTEMAAIHRVLVG